jgi:hypothetical protein
MPKVGLRYNQGKLPLSMILDAQDALLGCAAVLAFGAEKYDRGNWLNGLKYTETADSALRHLLKFLCGEELDPESGLPHVDHFLTNALFLSQMSKTHPQFDDRTKEHLVEKESTSNL